MKFGLVTSRPSPLMIIEEGQRMEPSTYPRRLVALRILETWLLQIMKLVESSLPVTKEDKLEIRSERLDGIFEDRDDTEAAMEEFSLELQSSDTMMKIWISYFILWMYKLSLYI